MINYEKNQESPIAGAVPTLCGHVIPLQALETKNDTITRVNICGHATTTSSFRNKDSIINVNTYTSR
jgi:hypothetical protein